MCIKHTRSYSQELSEPRFHAHACAGLIKNIIERDARICRCDGAFIILLTYNQGKGINNAEKKCANTKFVAQSRNNNLEHWSDKIQQK